MAGASVGSEKGVWRAGNFPITIEYPAPLLDEIRQAAFDGFRRLPHGGIEIGGVLFGTYEGDLIRILAFRPLSCEHALGPGFVLSETDQEALRKMLQEAAADPELKGLEPVGWYHSHTRSQILLSQRDLEIYARFFPERWQVALVLRPEGAAAVRAGFFFREPDGKIRSESSYQEFVLAPVRSGIPRRPPVETLPPPVPVLVPKSPRPERRRGRRWLWIAAPLLALAIAGGFALSRVWLRDRNNALALRLADSNGQLRIEWNRLAGPIREAQSGLLEILDGGQKTEIHFDGERLREGSVMYARRAGEVDVRLEVLAADGRRVEETVQFIGPAIQVKAPPEETEVARQPEPPQEQLMPAAPAVEQRKRADRGGESARPSFRPTAQFQQPAPQGSRTSAPPALPQPPRVPSSGAALPANAAISGQALQAPPPPETEPAPAPSRAEPSPPAYHGPPSGRIIWIGQLAKGAEIVIKGGRCSRGSVTAELPGVPVQVRVYPAELTSEGITMFASDRRGAGVVEPPGPQNGWNRTVFVWQPKRARDVVVLEPPGPQNNWKGMVLRGERDDLSLIIMDWHVIR